MRIAGVWCDTSRDGCEQVVETERKTRMKTAMLATGFPVALVLGLPVHAALTDGLVAYWPLDEDGEDKIGGVIAIAPSSWPG